jgi:methionyl-tRNA formyltransferase
VARKAKLVVLATGDLAIPVVGAVMEAGHEVGALVGQLPQPEDSEFLPEQWSGVALESWARERGLELLRRRRPSSDAVRRELEELAPDLGLIVTYGRSFPVSLLEVPRRGWIKVHFSLLPKYRGLHPIRAALWHGESQSGASVIQVTEEPDAGPILEQESVPIGSDETFGELAPRVAAVGAALVVPAIARVLRSKSPKTRSQNEKGASSSPSFGRRHRTSAWWRDAAEVANRLRALSPEPGMTTLIKGERVRILHGVVADYIQSPIARAGSFIGLRSGRIAVLCGDGKAFAIDRLEREDGAMTDASSFAIEKRLKVGDRLV